MSAVAPRLCVSPWPSKECSHIQWDQLGGIKLSLRNLSEIHNFKICEQSFRKVNMTKATTRYLTKNVRLTFLKLLDDERNERYICNFSTKQTWQHFARIVDTNTVYESATEESGSEAEPDMLTAVPKLRAKKRRWFFRVVQNTCSIYRGHFSFFENCTVASFLIPKRFDFHFLSVFFMKKL